MTTFDALFEPRSVAVVGASPGGRGPANNFLAFLRAGGFAGPVYAIHPSAQEIDGVKAYPGPQDLPQAVDYLYVAVGAARVPALVAAARGRVRVAQVISSGFGESEAGRGLETQLIAAAQSAQVRVIGPNSLGTHAPRSGLSFVDGARAEPGTVGVLSQSGGLAADIVRRGQVRGLRFSGVVSAGNCADVKLAELFEHLEQDAHTQVIGLYLENAAEARALFERLRHARGAKPVVLLKGGQTERGQAAAASHTGALASDFRLWIGMCRQTGAVLVDSLDEFVDALLAFQCWKAQAARPVRRVVLFGNGGGTSVLATDQCVRHGLEVPKFEGPVREALATIDLPPGAVIDNPIDVPANALRNEGGSVAARILDQVHAAGVADAVIMHVNMAVVMGYRSSDILGHLLDAALGVRQRHAQGARFALVLRTDGDLETEAARHACRARALAAGIPVFGEPADAARALASLGRYEAWLRDRSPPPPRGGPSFP